MLQGLVLGSILFSMYTAPLQKSSRPSSHKNVIFMQATLSFTALLPFMMPQLVSLREVSEFINLWYLEWQPKEVETSGVSYGLVGRVLDS